MLYSRLKQIFEKISKDIDCYVVANIGFDFLKVMIFFIIIFDVCAMISVYINVVLGSVLIFLFALGTPIVLYTKLACIGTTEKDIFIVHLKTFKMEEKQIYRIPIDKIRSITVSKFLFNTSLKISFISEEGKLEKKKYKFMNFVIGKPEMKENVVKVYERLVEIQKVIDKGDF